MSETARSTQTARQSALSQAIEHKIARAAQIEAVLRGNEERRAAANIAEGRTRWQVIRPLPATLNTEDDYVRAFA